VTITTGIHRLEADAYHGDPAPAPSLSSTLAKLMLAQSPLHAWTASPRLNPDWEPNDSKTFDIGRAAHRAILGAGSDYVEIPEELLGANGAATTKAAKEFIAEAREKGLTPLKGAEVAEIEAMQTHAAAKLAALGIALDPARSEMAALAEIDGTWCRCMVDNAPADPRQPLFDFKTTTNAGPDAAMRAVMNYGYDVQAAHYVETWKAATGEERRFVFLFQEKTAPYELTAIELDGEALDMARKKTRRAREMWADCLAKDSWPGYALGIFKVPLPAFFHERWLERESVEADYRARTGQDMLDAARAWQAPSGWAAE